VDAPPRGSELRWVSASDLAEYTYCPRSWWYADHPPPGGVARSNRRARESGRRYHDRSLRGESRRERWGVPYALLLALAVALVLGGLAWTWG
jgi:CRISPR/Cas system-associated exonuclease Cas4 (RecB family)